MSELLALAALLSLTNWRIASILYSEQMFDWGRKRFGITHDADGPVMYPGTFAGKVFECFWCLSLVSGAFLTISILPLTGLWRWGIILWLASSTGSIMIERWMRIGRSKAR